MSLAAPWHAAGRRLMRMMAVVRIESSRLAKDRVAISLIALVPAVQILLFGYAVNLDPKSVPAAIAGGGEFSVGHATHLLSETGYFKIVGERLPPGAAERMVIDGKALVGIELPPETDDHQVDDSGKDDAQEAEPRPPSPRVIVDAADPGVVRPALGALETAYWRQAATVFSFGPPLPVQVEWLYNPRGRTDWTLVPGLVGVIVMISTLMLGAMTLVRERERGSWEALLATPIGALDALVGKLMPYLLIGTLQGMIVIGIARLLFDLPLTPGVGALLAALPLYAGAHLILGFALSALAESQMQAMQGTVFFYLPSMLLSGFMFPFEGMPGWARTIGEMLPLTHFVRAARGVLLKGDAGVIVVHEMRPVALFVLGAATVALAAYRRRLD